MEILLLLCVSVSPVSHRQHTGDRTTDPFLCSVPGKENSIFIPMCFPFRRGCVVSVGCGLWPLAALPARSVTIRLQWLVEHSGVDLSPLAGALNHFSSQLCNLSPTSPHKTASLRCAFAHLQLSRLMPFTSRSEAFLNSPSHGCARDESFTGVWQGINHTICDCFTYSGSSKED